MLGPDCCCGNDCGEICVTANDPCGTAARGAKVTVKTLGGTTVGTCTTNSIGQCCAPTGGLGTFHLTIAPTNYDPQTSSVTVTSCTKHVTIEVGGSGTVRCGDCICERVPNELFFTDSKTGETVTLTYSSSTGDWTGSHTYSVSPDCAVAGGGCSPPISVTVNLQLTFDFTDTSPFAKTCGAMHFRFTYSGPCFCSISGLAVATGMNQTSCGPTIQWSGSTSSAALWMYYQNAGDPATTFLITP